MTVYELIQQLAKLPADMEVVVQRSSQKRTMEPRVLARGDIGRRNQPARNEVVLLCEWSNTK